MQKFVTVVFIHSHSALCLPCVDSSDAWIEFVTLELLHSTSSRGKKVSFFSPPSVTICMYACACMQEMMISLPCRMEKGLARFHSRLIIFHHYGALGHKLADLWNVFSS